MKKIVCFVISLIFSGVAAHAQWKAMDLPEGYYRDMYFPVQNKGFIVGNDGMILKTTNEGESWTSVESGTKANLYSIHFPTSQVGYIVGDSIILKTINGGNNWQFLKYENMIKPMRKVWFISEDVGFIESEYAYGYRTKDGGKTWTSVYGSGLSGVSFFSPSIGYRTHPGGIYKTLDTGVSWEYIPYKESPPRYPQTSTFIDENTGFIGSTYGQRMLASTFDGGKSWEEAIDETGLLKDGSGTIGSGIRNFYFPTKQVGYAIGLALDGIIKTKDSGKNWTYLKIKGLWFGSSASKAYFFNEKLGYLLNNDRVLKTTTGGEITSNVEQSEIPALKSNIFPNPFKNSSRIELPENLLQPKITIFTINGEDCSQCFKTDFQKNAVVIQRLEAASGAYYYKIESNGKSVGEGKFIVE